MDYCEELRSGTDALLEEVRRQIEITQGDEVVYYIPDKYNDPNVKCAVARILQAEGHEVYASYFPASHCFGGGNKMLLKLKGN